MIKYRTVVVEDDLASRMVLVKTLEKCFEEIELIGEAVSVSTGIELIEREKPEVVFLDIKMSDGTGFDLLSQLDHKNFRVIFTTAYPEYAIKAFKYSAFDYILKPIVPDDLTPTINRLSQMPATTDTVALNHLSHQIAALEGNNTVDEKPTIALPDLNGFSIVPVEDISRVEGERNYSRVFFNDKPDILVSRTLMEFENLLIPHGFMRIHRSFLVNMSCVVRYIKAGGGMIELIDGTQLKVSAKYKDDLLNRLLVNRL